MARHRSDFAGERLTARIDCKIAPGERSRVETAAAEQGITPSDFTRNAVLEALRAHAIARPHRLAKQAADAALTERLNKLGSRLNDEARAANEQRKIREAGTIARLSGELIAALQEIAPQNMRQPMTDERRALIAAVHWIGNNVQQLAKVAATTGRREIGERLEAIEAQIIASFELVTP